MKNSTKVLIILGVVLLAVGVAVFVTGMALGDWKFFKFETVKYETNTYEVSGEFDKISVNTSIDGIAFVLSDGGECKVVCQERENTKHSVEVKDGTLVISYEETGKWYEHISLFSDGSPKMTVYLPKAEYSSLKIDEETGDVEIPADFKFGMIDVSASTGDVKCYAAADSIKIGLSTGAVRVENVSTRALDISVSTGRVAVQSVDCAGDIKIKVSTGNAKLGGVECDNLTSDGSTGKIVLDSVIASGKIHIERSTGDVEFSESDAGEIFAKTTTGDIKGTLLSDKIFIAKSDTGSIDVPATESGGKCELITSTGDIKISVTK